MEGVFGAEAVDEGAGDVEEGEGDPKNEAVPFGCLVLACHLDQYLTYIFQIPSTTLPNVTQETAPTFIHNQ